MIWTSFYNIRNAVSEGIHGSHFDKWLRAGSHCCFANEISRIWKCIINIWRMQKIEYDSLLVALMQLYRNKSNSPPSHLDINENKWSQYAFVHNACSSHSLCVLWRLRRQWQIYIIKAFLLFMTGDDNNCDSDSPGSVIWHIIFTCKTCMASGVTFWLFEDVCFSERARAIVCSIMELQWLLFLTKKLKITQNWNAYIFWVINS